MASGGFEGSGDEGILAGVDQIGFYFDLLNCLFRIGIQFYQHHYAKPIPNNIYDILYFEQDYQMGREIENDIKKKFLGAELLRDG